ncbi:hypothetical protein E0485_11605 [Paenibacillus albiflavus]|uniref:Uncharacterized protein n=1 Tax=Paenibacillus albiflavus TaxID=2545760 RepID=A0A4R4EG56_9BACL|nr:hypothetical protein [Paenibacillus albiflavus]TCZ77105.1 hypothetical protein E0485_11605 [Paenibacillus albiflavus]
MIRGSHAVLEQEINAFIHNEAYGDGVYHVEHSILTHVYPADAPYVLYMGCGGRSTRPSFILGVGNLHTDQGALIISHYYKPRSYIMAFTEAVKELFEGSSTDYIRSLVMHWGQVYKEMIEEYYREASNTQQIDLKTMDIWQNKEEIEAFIRRERKHV